MTRRAAQAGRILSWGVVPILVVTFSAVPAAADSGWLGAVSADLAAREYAFRPDGLDRISAPNRAQGLCAAAAPDGIEITARCSSAHAAPITLALRAFGRESASGPVQRARFPRADGSSARLERGPVVEWMRNAPRGFEHGFTLATAPAGSGAVILEIAVEGALVRAEDPAGRSLLLLDPAGRPALRYAELVAYDASRRPLAARMDPVPGGLRIAIDDAGAGYPLTIDPLATSAAWSAEPDQAGAAYGLAVATAGDVNGDGFSDLLVGAPLFDAGALDAGAAFLYLGSAAGPALTASWSALGTESGAGFGRAVAAAGDVNGDGYQDVAIGADGCDGGGTDAGCVSIFYGSSAGLPAAPSLLLIGPQAGAAFGRFVAGAGDLNGDGYADVAVGAPLLDDPLTDEGKVFVYLGSALGLSTLPAWSAAAGQAGAELGAVGGAGDVNGDGFDDLVAGAPRWSGGEADEGKAWLYHGGPGGPPAVANWSIESGNAGARFGEVVGTAGDVNGDGFSDLFVGAPRFSGGDAEEGAAFVYYGGAGSPSGPWTYQPDVAGARAGSSVATAGDLNGDGRADLVVGLERWSSPEVDEGRAVAFLGTSGGLAAAPYWSHEVNQAGARFATVATAGDVNGDGFSDLVVGADGFDGGQAGEGAAFLFYGAGDAPATQVAWSAQASGGWQLFGQSVAAAGDVDGDGYGDVIIGDPGFLGAGGTAVGLAALYPGSAAGPSLMPSWTASGLADSAFGISVAGAGDVDGDGYVDVIVGASDHSNGLLREGASYLYRGGPAGLAAAPAWSVEGELAGARLGWSVAGAGDVNGDGYGDVAIGAPDYTPDGSAALLYAGRVTVYHGGPTGLGATPAWTRTGDEYASDFGYSVAPAGDVDGDGFSDLLVGDPLHLGTFLGGQVYLFAGAPGGLSASPSWTAEGEDAVDDFGRSVATAGDVNRDGFSDLLVGADGVNVDAWRDAGRAYLYLGGPTGPSGPAAWSYPGRERQRRPRALGRIGRRHQRRRVLGRDRRGSERDGDAGLRGAGLAVPRQRIRPRHHAGLERGGGDRVQRPRVVRRLGRRRQRRRVQRSARRRSRRRRDRRGVRLVRRRNGRAHAARPAAADRWHPAAAARPHAGRLVLRCARRRPHAGRARAGQARGRNQAARRAVRRDRRRRRRAHADRRPRQRRKLGAALRAHHGTGQPAAVRLAGAPRVVQPALPRARAGCPWRGTARSRPTSSPPAARDRRGTSTPTATASGTR